MVRGLMICKAAKLFREKVYHLQVADVVYTWYDKPSDRTVIGTVYEASGLFRAEYNHLQVAEVV
jgi:hypothetical protein